MNIAHIGLLGVALYTAQVFGSSFLPDADTATTGIQATNVLTDTGMTLIVEFDAAAMTDLFSYEFSVRYDTTKLLYKGGDKDYGFDGRQNILTTKGGAVQGLCQKRRNPLRPDIIDVAYTIIGADKNQQVSGDGLIGVLSFKSRMQHGDSSTISIISGAWASLDGSLQKVDTIGYAAVFVAKPCTLTITSSLGGTCAPAGSLVCRLGDTIGIKASASKDFQFSKWTIVNGVKTNRDSTADSTGVVISGDNPMVRAIFSPISSVRFMPGQKIAATGMAFSRDAKREWFDCKGAQTGPNLRSGVHFCRVISANGVYLLRTITITK
jgi:hypothetical protein